ncbi:hypothetical protein ACEPAF_6065 [Sanghuangporus sanghuang]
MLPEPFPLQQQQQQQHQMLPQNVDSPMEVDSAPLQVETGETIENGEVAEPVETLETGAERFEGASRSTPLTSLEPTMLEIELCESERREEEECTAQCAEISRMAAEIEANMRRRLDAGTRCVRGVWQVVDSDEETPAIQESPESPPPGHRGEDSIVMSPGDGGMDIGDVGMEANEPFEADASLEEIQALNTTSNNNNSNNNNNSGTAAVPHETVETRARRISPVRRASSQPEAGPSRIPANGGGSGGDDNNNDDNDDDDGDEQLSDGRVETPVHCLIAEECHSSWGLFGKIKTSGKEKGDFGGKTREALMRRSGFRSSSGRDGGEMGLKAAGCMRGGGIGLKEIGEEARREKLKQGGLAVAVQR